MNEACFSLPRGILERPETLTHFNLFILLRKPGPFNLPPPNYRGNHAAHLDGRQPDSGCQRRDLQPPTASQVAQDSNAEFKTHSDCEVILHLYKEHGTDFVSMLDGMFSFILLDTSVKPHRCIAARDPIGITTFYQGWSYKYPGAVYFSSELKAIHDECDRIRAFPPGHFYDSSLPEGQETVRYYKPKWWHGDEEGAALPKGEADLTAIREALERAVRKRLMSEVPYGVLLSGGLDSSLIASIAARETSKVAEAQRLRFEEKRAKKAARVAEVANGVGADGAPDGLPVGIDEDAENEADTLAAWPRLHSFSIGLPGSPDLLAAREAARFLGTVHHEHTFTVQEGLDAVRDVIYHLETYDVTTVRASTPMYLLSRKIKAMGVKMVLSGEGSDEIFGGYLYFHAAPTADEFPPGVRSKGQEPAHGRLPSRQQEHHGLGPRSSRAILGQELPRGRHGCRCQAQDVQQGLPPDEGRRWAAAYGKVHSAQSL
ncbi:hypothetical protein L7F22_040074 [Adiantum nelumboides]|nr:hypothetical protein [Adiantum nelumboides]